VHVRLLGELGAKHRDRVRHRVHQDALNPKHVLETAMAGRQDAELRGELSATGDMLRRYEVLRHLDGRVHIQDLVWAACRDEDRVPLSLQEAPATNLDAGRRRAASSAAYPALGTQLSAHVRVEVEALVVYWVVWQRRDASFARYFHQEVGKLVRILSGPYVPNSRSRRAL